MLVVSLLIINQLIDDFHMQPDNDNNVGPSSKGDDADAWKQQQEELKVGDAESDQFV